MLRDVQDQLEIAEDGIAACPAELSERRHHEMVNVLRTRELLSDVLGAGAVAETAPSTARSPKADQQRVARTSSPQATAQRTTPSASTSVPPASAPPPRRPRTR
ncbi:hypothetical protein ACIHCQ_44355 [Streptomyces sp. NPDC052236]|uniref:hypothetical protein n=1 Tax=Streptomyces sp. NPDC052236 TaxID=3365686 RepID=UPI0037D91249